jgi:hypothetical protein
MLSITIPDFHNLNNFLGREDSGLPASYLVAADAAGAAVGFAAVGADAFAFVDGFAAVIASRLRRSGFLLQNFSSQQGTCRHLRIKVSENTKFTKHAS